MSADKERAPSITLTPSAVEKLTEVVGAQSRPVAGLRLQIAGRQGGEFQHILSLVEHEPEGDTLVEVEGLRVFVDGRNAEYLDGIQVHYEYRGPNVSGLHFMNPNPLWIGEPEVLIQQILDSEINPAIASHGGYVNLLGVEGPIAFVELGGGCQGCGMADVTLKQGIEVAIIEKVPGIERVVDQTDHAAGQNPYFQPAKK